MPAKNKYASFFVTQRFVQLLRIVDKEKFVLGKVYWFMYKAIFLANVHEKCKPIERKNIVSRVQEL